MSEIIHPILETKQIIKATVLALIIGIIILVIAVLPAEYGIDPIGAGKYLGFSRLYQQNETNGDTTSVKMIAQELHPLLKLEDGGSKLDVKRPKEADNPAPKKQFAEREDTIQVNVRAGAGIEYKINMLKYGRVKYEWATDKGTLFFDFHGEVKQANPPGNVYYESYTLAYSNNVVGDFLSPFEGKHGWYFKNKGDADIIVSLRLKGQYELRE